MNKSDLVSRVAAEADLSRRAAESAVNVVFSAIQGAVAKGERVFIPGFGTFEKRARSARTGRNPRTGETLKIKPTSVPAFRAGQGFKDAVGGARRAAGRGTPAKKTVRASRPR